MSSPALARAKDAFVVTHDARADDPSLTYSEFLDLLLRDAVSAALHDPDDPDWLVGVVKAAIDQAYTFEGDLDPDVDRLVADAVRATILGEAS